MAGAKTNQQLTNELQQIRTLLDGLNTQLNEIKQNVNSRPMRSDLARSEANQSSKIKDNSEIINKIEQKLSKISLPDSTRYYLSETEVGDFRANFNKLLAMLASFDQLYKNLVSYSVNNVGNS